MPEIRKTIKIDASFDKNHVLGIVRPSKQDPAGAPAPQVQNSPALRPGCFHSLFHLLELGVVQVGVEAALCQEFLVVPLFDDVALLHHEDEVRIADRGEPVGDDEASISLSGS